MSSSFQTEEDRQTWREWRRNMRRLEEAGGMDSLMVSQSPALNQVPQPDEFIHGAHLCIISNSSVPEYMGPHDQWRHQLNGNPSRPADMSKPTYIGLIRERGVKPANLPGGKINEGESYYNALVREIGEEMPNSSWVNSRISPINHPCVISVGRGVISQIFMLTTSLDHLTLNYYIPELEFHRLDHLTDLDYIRANNIAEYTYRHANEINMSLRSGMDLSECIMFTTLPVKPGTCMKEIICGRGHSAEYEPRTSVCFCGQDLK